MTRDRPGDIVAAIASRKRPPGSFGFPIHVSCCALLCLVVVLSLAHFTCHFLAFLRSSDLNSVGIVHRSVYCLSAPLSNYFQRNGRRLGKWWARRPVPPRAMVLRNASCHSVVDSCHCGDVGIGSVPYGDAVPAILQLPRGLFQVASVF